MSNPSSTGRRGILTAIPAAGAAMIGTVGFGELQQRALGVLHHLQHPEADGEQGEQSDDGVLQK